MIIQGQGFYNKVLLDCSYDDINNSKEVVFLLVENDSEKQIYYFRQASYDASYAHKYSIYFTNDPDGYSASTSNKLLEKTIVE